MLLEDDAIDALLDTPGFHFAEVSELHKKEKEFYF